MEEFFDLAIERLRMQRHDFMNYFQVIMGYIQLNRTGDATAYIKDINYKMVTLSQIYNIECPELSLLLQDLLDYLEKVDINVKFNCEADYINNTVFSKNIYDKKKLFIDIKNKLEIYSNDSKTQNIFIHIGGSPDNFIIFFSNDEKFLNEAGNSSENDSIPEVICEKQSEYCLRLYSTDNLFCFKLHIF